MDLLSQTLVFGLSNAAIYILLALGISLIFGVLGVMNFAHGEFSTVGAYTVVVLVGISINELWIGLVAGALVSGVVGAVCYLAVIRPMQQRPPLMTLLATFGLALALQGLVFAIWGGGARSLPRNEGAWSILGVTVPETSGINIVVAAATVVTLMLVLSRTAFGREMRAVAQNRREAQLAGIDPRRIELLAVVLSAMVAGIAGVMLTQRNVITPFTGFELVLTAFAIAIVAGLGRLQGVVLVALALGLSEGLVTTYVDASLANIVVFVALLLTLIVRPQGLAGLATRA